MRRTGVLAVALLVVAAACTSDGTAGPDAGATRAVTLRIVNQNLLHGTACAAGGNRCDLPGRVELFARQLAAAGCPEIVAIEEANPVTVTELETAALDECGYELVTDDDPGSDREVLLTTETVLGYERLDLAGPLRTMLRARLGTDAGPVDVIATHLASGSDDRPCDPGTCPPPCRADDTVNTCQARQIVTAVDEDPPRDLLLLAGDLNARPDEATIAALTNAGLVDTHLTVGNAECGPTATDQCTSGRADDSLVDMTDAQSRQTERIDYVFVTPTPRCRVVRPTGVFAVEGGPTTGDGLVFPADHSGVIATVRCRAGDADRAANRPMGTTSTRPGSDAGTAVTSDVQAAVTAAFTGLFAPNPDADAQLGNLENGAALRDSFVARKEAVGALADRTSVRIDSFDGATADTVDITFSILLDGTVVLDSLPGQAKLIDGRWLVTTASYCQVATLGVDTIPEACHANS
jgi:endonuclease/exonuclease/phosphatase family metal-dependent hydrolase